MAVACGESQTAAVTEDGSLYTWGAGHDAQLGLTAFYHRLVPTLVGGLDVFAARIVMLAAGLYHSAALVSDGSVWTWGIGFSGRLGHGDERTRLSPMRRGKEWFGESAAVMVACGELHTMVVTADGELWTFGGGYHGRLGHG